MKHPGEKPQGTAWPWRDLRVTEEEILSHDSVARWGTQVPFGSCSWALLSPLAKPRPWGLHSCGATSFQALHLGPHANWAPTARSTCVICPDGPSAPLPLRPEDSFGLSPICPGLFHSLWRLPTPRLQPPKFSAPLSAHLPELILLLAGCSSPTTLPDSSLMGLLLPSPCLSRYASSVGWSFLSLKKNLANGHYQNIIYSIQYSILLFGKEAGYNFQFIFTFYRQNITLNAKKWVFLSL